MRPAKANQQSHRHITSVEISQIGPPIGMPSCCPRLQPSAERKPAAVPMAEAHRGRDVGLHMNAKVLPVDAKLAEDVLAAVVKAA